jgi:predicted nucleic acid-binding protein
METVYLETTIISYLTAWRSQQTVMAGRQDETRDWWDNHRSRYELFTSQLVLEEATRGDPVAAKRRLEILIGIPLLAQSKEIDVLAERLKVGISLPTKAEYDAFHIAVAAVHGMDYLLTWNCRHIANVKHRTTIESICRSAGFEPPLICTPAELMED